MIKTLSLTFLLLKSNFTLRVHYIWKLDKCLKIEAPHYSHYIPLCLKHFTSLQEKCCNTERKFQKLLDSTHIHLALFYSFIVAEATFLQSPHHQETTIHQWSKGCWSIPLTQQLPPLSCQWQPPSRGPKTLQLQKLKIVKETVVNNEPFDDGTVQFTWRDSHSTDTTT